MKEKEEQNCNLVHSTKPLVQALDQTVAQQEKDMRGLEEQIRDLQQNLKEQVTNPTAAASCLSALNVSLYLGVLSVCLYVCTLNVSLYLDFFLSLFCMLVWLYSKRFSVSYL